MINTIKNDDGTYTVTYAGREVGYIAKVRLHATKERAWRAVSTLGLIRYESSLPAARRAIIGAMH